MLDSFFIQTTKTGKLERVNLKLDLSELLLAFLSLYETGKGDQKTVFKHIQAGLEEHLRYSDPNHRRSTKFRFATARWLRLKDIAHFVFFDGLQVNLKIKVAKILSLSLPLAEKWNSIKNMLVSEVSEESLQELSLSYSCETGAMHPILEWVALMFLEQDPEPPPPNLRLELVRGEFPKSYWTSRKGSYHKSSPFWLPKNSLCHATHLAFDLNRDFTKNEQHLVKIADHAPLGRPSSISLEFPDEKEEAGQLSMIPETAAETLSRLQRMIEKKMGANGVRHLFGVLRQVSSADNVRFFFDFEAHAHLLGYEDKVPAQYHAEEQNLEDVLEILKKVEIRRRYLKIDPIVEQATPLLNGMAKEYKGISKKIAGQEMMLDAFALGDGTSLSIGAHLNLVPESAFKEDVKKHKLVLPLATYMAGTWVMEYSQKRGELQKTATELLEGCALRMTPQSKRTILTKLKSELDYMVKKDYISNFTMGDLGSSEPQLQPFTITPPSYFLAGMKETYSYATHQVKA